VRIGLDYLPATTHPPGVGRYARELVRALVQLDDRPDLALCEIGRDARGADPASLGLTRGDPRVTRFSRAWPRRFVDVSHALLGRGADRLLGGVDVFHHVIAGALPVSRARQTIAVAELPAAGSEREAVLRAVLARMDAIFVFSADFKSRLVQHYRIPPERIAQVHVGCEHWRRALATLPERDAPPRIVVLGAVRRARRPLPIFRAFERLAARGLDLHLEFASAPTPRGIAPDPAALELERTLSDSKLRERVFWTTPAESRRLRAAPDPWALEASLPRRVASASVLVHLSEDEGTAVTPLEALALGVPVVASRIPAFAEALGDAGILVDDAESTREPEVLADAILRAIESAGDAHAAARNTLVAREFNWERCARETLAVWRGLA
jgi:glycosyltransferase involved in cell wall biosynthesis